MRGATLQNLKVFRRLCGKKNLKAVVFGTTKSSKLTPEAFAMREKELTDVYWKDFKKQGAIVFNLLPSHDSAHQLVQTVLDRVQERRVLRIQKELVDLAKTLPATDAGKELKHTLEEIMKHQKRALAGDNLTDEQIAAHKRKIATIAPQIKQLTMKHSFSQRLSKFFGLVSCFAGSYDHLSHCLRAVEEDTKGLRSRQNDLLNFNLVQSRCASHRDRNISNSVLLSAHLLLPRFFICKVVLTE